MSWLRLVCLQIYLIFSKKHSETVSKHLFTHSWNFFLFSIKSKKEISVSLSSLLRVFEKVTLTQVSFQRVSFAFSCQFIYVQVVWLWVCTNYNHSMKHTQSTSEKITTIRAVLTRIFSRSTRGEKPFRSHSTVKVPALNIFCSP